MKRIAIIGAVVWCGLWLSTLGGIVDLSWIALLFALAPLVIVPLGLHLTDQMENSSTNSLPERWARAVHAPAALLAVVSLLLAPGLLAGAFASAWIAFCALLAACVPLRLCRGGLARLDALFPAVSFTYSLVGAAWLVASRLGLNPMGFQEPIVLLTAVHFHYAGFAAPLLARPTGRAFGHGGKSTLAIALYRVVAPGVLLGPGVLAMGFVIGPRVKLAAALILALSEVCLAFLFVSGLVRIRPFAAQLLLTLAAASVAFSMALAAVWAIGEYPLQPFVNLDQMERFHGTANAFGFTLCGMLGWLLAGEKDEPSHGGQP